MAVLDNEIFCAALKRLNLRQRYTLAMCPRDAEQNAKTVIGIFSPIIQIENVHITMQANWLSLLLSKRYDDIIWQRNAASVAPTTIVAIDIMNS